jgi:hypothetical protein
MSNEKFRGGRRTPTRVGRPRSFRQWLRRKFSNNWKMNRELTPMELLLFHMNEHVSAPSFHCLLSSLSPLPSLPFYPSLLPFAPSLSSSLLLFPLLSISSSYLYLQACTSVGMVLTIEGPLTADISPFLF